MIRQLAAVFVVLIALALPGRAAAETAPAATAVPGASPAATQPTGEHRPWGRLAIFVPVSVLLGVGAITGRRIARDRGWLAT
jgi:hypothetical protein